MHMKRLNARMLTLAGTAVLVLGAASDIHAATQTANLDVTASVTANCSISTAAVAFGAYDPVVANASADNDATGTVSVTCTSGASTTVTLGQGANADAGSTAAAPVRRMNDGGSNYISYALYSENTRTTVWADTGPTGVPHTGDGTLTALTVYGRITAGQNVPAGSYSDTVVATVTF
jgi:spore coat protein U domain-containing protein, fimbrial subunit CupE1/2/3/6